MPALPDQGTLKHELTPGVRGATLHLRIHNALYELAYQAAVSLAFDEKPGDQRRPHDIE